VKKVLEFDLSKIRDFEATNGVGPKKDRFSTQELAVEYAKLLKALWGPFYELKEIKHDEHGYYQVPVERYQ
jgi:hypothetical protein